MSAKLCRAGMPPSNGMQCLESRGVSDGASAQDCSIAQREAPDAAPGVCMFYGLEFVRDVRSAKATGAADVGRLNGRGVIECASARERGMADDAEIGSTRDVSRSGRTFGGSGVLKSGRRIESAKRGMFEGQ